MSELAPNSPPRPGLDPKALPIAAAARMLSAAGGQRVDVEMLEADIAAGAPVNADGTLNLVHYAAWLVQEMSGRGD
ncbi:MAG: hypothetical protein JNG88_08855 [Phycisphaerales bacterium]|nr:hypothetical protein [Phycisphaerales bacterium]